MSSFRASPWVSYEPTSSSHRHRQQDTSESNMDEDVDMDAPQISTLREEESPPPPPAQKKVVITPKKRPAPPPPPPPIKSGKAQDEFEEEDQLIDELIDDDDNGNHAKPSPSHPGRATDAAQKRKVSTKRKLKKSDKLSADVPKEKKVKERVSQAMGAHHLAPTMSWFKATPAESHEDTDTLNANPIHHPAESSASTGRKKVSPRKPPTIPRAKLKLAAKQKSAIPPLLLEDPAVLSESYAGTAASSPVTAQFEQNSPEPENMPASSPPLTSAALPEEGSQEDSLENVPIPMYPLPTKPFPVQPPAKIATGFAPLLPLDKSGRKVRHWREANREIRGIAGGRWLARTWVGEKESDYASFVSVSNAQIKPAGDEKASNGMSLPKLSSVAISAPATTKALGKLKSSKSASALTSANPSRASSSIPDTPTGNIPINGSAVRAPTKMRILQLAHSAEAGDSDMVPALNT